MSNERQQRAARAEQMRKEREKADRKQRNLITVGIVVVVIALIAVGGYAIKSENDKNKKVRPRSSTRRTRPRTSASPTRPPMPAARSRRHEAGLGRALRRLPVPACCKSFEQAERRVPQGCRSRAARSRSRTAPSRSSTRPVEAPTATPTAPPTLRCASSTRAASTTTSRSTTTSTPTSRRSGPAGPENADLITALKGLGVTGIDSCVRTERFVPWVDKAKAAGAKLGVNATPTVMVGGKKVESPTPDVLQKAIDAAKKS